MLKWYDHIEKTEGKSNRIMYISDGDEENKVTKMRDEYRDRELGRLRVDFLDRFFNPSWQTSI